MGNPNAVATLKAKAADMRERIMELSRQGITNEVVAEMLGISTKTVERARVHAGVGQPQKRATKQDKLRAKLMLDDGACYEEVARTIGFKSCAVKRWYPGFTWDRSQVAHAGVLSRKLHDLEKRTKNNLVDC